ncbi:CD209 antigen-like protein A [Centropristis striata]|uniref:CD209 antigen-like protein A n=1 Tax=Centropristis striata TaxID=184440 RepID=UPI0027E0C0F8|nr:CD209 antigen-like protein A [Centropristis striata]
MRKCDTGQNSKCVETRGGQIEMSETISDNDLGEQQKMEKFVLITAGENDEADERTVAIYYSTDSNEGHKAATQSSVQQQPGRTFFRVVAVCLVLLFYLLLAGITGTGLHYRFKLQTLSRSWAENRNQTLAEFNHFCKDGCKSFSNSFYYISSGWKSWEDSRQDCRDRGADLVIVTNEEEQVFINSFNKGFWIGLTDREEEGTWRWVDGSVLNSSGFWYPGQPNKYTWKENCVNTFQHGELNSWHDDDCSTSGHWICEKPMDV